MPNFEKKNLNNFFIEEIILLIEEIISMDEISYEESNKKLFLRSLRFFVPLKKGGAHEVAGDIFKFPDGIPL